MSQGKSNAGCGVTQPFAAIAATYPNGWACDCSNGVVTLGPKNSKGRWIFGIPYAGKWTARAKNDLYNTNVESFDVAQNGTYEAKLMYENTLFGKGGIELTTDSWKVIESDLAEGSVSVLEGALLMDITPKSTETSAYNVMFYAVDPVELVGIDKLVFNFTNLSSVTEVYIGISSENPGIIGSSVELLAESRVSSTGETTISIDGYNGTYYLAVSIRVVEGVDVGESETSSGFNLVKERCD